MVSHENAIISMSYGRYLNTHLLVHIKADISYMVVFLKD